MECPGPNQMLKLRQHGRRSCLHPSLQVPRPNGLTELPVPKALKCCCCLPSQPLKTQTPPKLGSKSQRSSAMWPSWAVSVSVCACVSSLLCLRTGFGVGSLFGSEIAQSSDFLGNETAGSSRSILVCRSHSSQDDDLSTGTSCPHCLTFQCFNTRDRQLLYPFLRQDLFSFTSDPNFEGPKPYRMKPN